MSFSTGERRGGMRSKIVLEMSAEVHVSDSCGPWKWHMGFGAKKLPVGPTVHYVNKPILIFFLNSF